MADLDREPFWSKEKGWSHTEEQEVRKIRFEAHGQPCSNVTPCGEEVITETVIFGTLYPTPVP